MILDLSKATPNLIYFEAETPDDIFQLGELKSKLQNSIKGFSINSRITLGVHYNELLTLALENKKYD